MKEKTKVASVADGPSVIDRLLTEGNYHLILVKIFLYLDGRTLTSASKVCPLWRDFLLENIWRNPKIKKLLEARLDSNWKNLRVTKNNFHLREVLPSFQEKVCNSYISKDNQLFILGKSYAKPGNKVVVTSGDLERPLMLSRGEEVSSGALATGKVAISYQTGLLRIWRSLKEGEACQESREAGGPAVALQIQDESIFLLGRDSSVRVFHTVLGRVVSCIPPSYGRRVTLFHVEAGLLATGSQDKTVEVWSLAEGALVHCLRGHTHAVSALHVVRPLIISGGWDSAVLVWRVRDGTLVHKLSTKGAWISRVAVCGTRIVAGDVRGAVMKWQIAEGEEVVMVEVAQLSDSIRGLRLDSRSLTAVAYEGQVCMWDFWV